MEEQQFQAKIDDLKTDPDELEQALQDYDLDESLVTEFDTLDEKFRELQILYKSLLNTRRFLNA